MPIIPDPTSPVGNTIPLIKSDIERMRSAVDDQHIAAKAYNLDPGFRKAADHYRQQQLAPEMQKNLPTLLLNRYYYGKWQLEKTDALTTALAKESTNPFNPFAPQNQKPQRPIEEIAPLVGGVAGSFGGPLGTFAGTAIGKGTESLVKSIKGEQEPSLMQGVAVPLAEGAVAGLTHLAVNKAVEGVSKAFKPPSVDELVQPKVTEGTLKEAVAKTPDLVKKGMLGDAKILPDVAEKRLAETARTIPEFGTKGDPIKNAQIVKKAIGDESNALRQAFQANDAALPHQEINAAIDQRLSEVAKDFPGEESAVKRIGDLWKQATKDAKGTISGHWDGRIGFDGEVESRFGAKIFEKGTARAEAVRAVRQTANQIIDQAATNAGMSFSPQINRLSDMYSILENLATKSTKAGNLSKVLKSPLGRAAAIGAAGAAGYGGLRTLTD